MQFRPTLIPALALLTTLSLGGTTLTAEATDSPTASADGRSHGVYTDAGVKDLPWLNSRLSAEQRTRLLLAKMTPAQKIHMLHGASSLIGTRIVNAGDPPSIGYIPAIPELRIPAFVMTDGPAGLRNTEKATVMPAPIAQAATFDPEVARSYGKLIAQESKDRGQDLLFGPGFNLARNPQAGRTFEYFGEDPLLAGTIAAANVHGLQDQGIMATLKHFVANNQETNRTQNSSNIDSRTLREIYEKPFQIAIEEAKPAAVMCAYNKVNHDPACGNREILIGDLRKRMGFEGIVVTDYPAAWSPTDVADGLNVELPWAFWTSESRIVRAIKDGKMTWRDVEQRVAETLTQMFRFGLFDHPWDEARGDRVREIKDIDAQRGYAAALDVAKRGAVLLKNNGILPLQAKDNPRRVLIVGNAAKNAAGGGGSSGGSALLKDSALEQIKKRLPQSEVIYKSAFDPAGIAIEAKRANLVIVFADQISTELIDRPNLDFLPHINNAVTNAATRNPNTVVVTQLGGPTLMPWEKYVSAILNVWYPGEAGGEATAQLLFGEANPGGRLPQTFPAHGKQFPANQAQQFPGGKLGHESDYSEGVMMGYRWYTTEQEIPAYPFGYGLSYTTFKYGKAHLNSDEGAVSVQIQLTNTGERAGRVTPQVYVRKPGTDNPARELVSFRSIELAAGETTQVTLPIKTRDLMNWDENAHKFSLRSGTYQIFVGDNVNEAQPVGELHR